MNKQLSIITINLNNREGLRRTIKSVISQTKRNDIQFIIIDGDSTDRSKDVIKEYENQIDYWISEKDNGIYDAMNKGINASEAPYCLFLNSGDYLYSNDVVEGIQPFMDGTDIIYGDEYKVRPNGTRYLAKYPNKLDEPWFKKTALPHQSTLIKTALLKERKYTEEYKLLGDWIWLREAIMKYNNSYKHINMPISVYSLDGMSSVGMATVNEEKKKYYEKS